MRQTKHTSYYQLLEVSERATPLEIKRAYRRLARVYHPDASVSTCDQRSFIEIKTAYEILSNPRVRRIYDRARARGGEVSLQQLQRARTKTTATKTHGVSRSAHQSSFSFAKSFTPYTQFLSRCLNNFFCKTATVFAQISAGISALKLRQSDKSASARFPQHVLSIDALSSLRGTVRTFKYRSPHGLRHSEVAIPPGVSSGSVLQIILPRQGSFPEEELLVRIEITAHPVVERRGLDIVVKMPLTPSEAAEGAEVDVPTLKGSARIRIPPAAAGPRRLRLPGRGLSSETDQGRSATGDLWVETYITYPEASKPGLAHTPQQEGVSLDSSPRAGIPRSLA